MNKKHNQYQNDPRDRAYSYYVSFVGATPPVPPVPPIPPMLPMHASSGKSEFASPHASIFAGPPGRFRTGSDINSVSHFYQEIDDDILELLVLLPGIDKSTLKVRSKSNKVRISANLMDEYIGKIGPEKLVMVMNLMETVDPSQADAKYTNGVLKLRIPVAESSSEISINENGEYQGELDTNQN